jgi:glycosyltransferase involved in cell wall biosynthesis
MTIGIILIGRNEGERLKRCIGSIPAGAGDVVYVDSGSTDGSVEWARGEGIEVVELDMSRPFTAARARNAGLERLLRLQPQTEFVQFVDGDCELQPGWLERAVKALSGEPELAAVCGRLRERCPEASIYNRLCDLEWNGPAGEISACGGIAMYRASALQAVGGFDESVVAGEEPELCLRLRRAGWKIRRLPDEMALHDAAMVRFGQWWKRAVRGGYGGLDVAVRFENGMGNFSRQVRSARIWGIGWPLAVIALALVGAAAGGVVAAALASGIVLAAFPLQVLRLSLRAWRKGSDPRTSLAYGTLTMLAKFASLCGQCRYWRDRRAGRQPVLIEAHKSPTGTPIAPIHA